MVRLSSLEAVERLYAARGGLSYGEGVTQMEHALQCAALAEADGADESLITAALLHDVGHLLEDETAVAAFKVDYRHQLVGAEALAGLFGEAVLAPITLHVAAKRYLCFAEPAYFDALSAASKATLRLQGGPFDSGEAAAFEAQPFWREAVALRRYDDMGKRDEAAARAFASFMPMMRRLMIDAVL